MIVRWLRLLWLEEWYHQGCLVAWRSGELTMAVEDKQNNKMPNKSSFLLLSVALYIINTRYMYYNFASPACYLSLSPYAQNAHWIFYLKCTWKCCNTITMSLMRTNFYYINNNENQVNFCLKTWLKCCWYA